MKISVNPNSEALRTILKRPELETFHLEATIAEIFREVELNGDAALKLFALKFDQVVLDSFEVTKTEIEQSEYVLDNDLKQAIRIAASNIELFHAGQKSAEPEIETTSGVFCRRKSVGIQTVGMYIPGGTAPLFSTVLMLGIPARLAGCPNRILCTPSDQNGVIDPAILYAAKVAGITQVFKIGGAQAIAAMALGTESIPKADKLFGPGNQYVTAAKLFAQKSGIPIDLPAGPSEVLVAADETIAPAIIASDLLAQAEHGIDSQVVFLTDSEAFVSAVDSELAKQLSALPRAGIASKALENSAVIVAIPEKWVEIINEYAPEHLIVMGKYEEQVAENVVNAGSVFIGENTAESFGDYASGTNHTLPTNGFARAYSGVSLDSFVKKITYQRVSKSGLRNLGPTVIRMAEAEKLQGHANAIKVRLSLLQTADETEAENAGNIEQWIRSDLRTVQPYTSARDEFEGIGDVFLDANENGFLNEYNRYPDPLQRELKQEIAIVKELPVQNLFLGNGSDEVLDLILRLTTTPYRDSIAYLNPSYGMYSALAKINALDTKAICLDQTFGITTDKLLEEAKGAKVLIICNPNNPTGNTIRKEELLETARKFNGVLVVDEAYVDFCPEFSMANEVGKFPNLLVVQTLSKAYAMAGLRIGMAIASEDWVQALNRIKPPYNLSSLVQEKAVSLLKSTNWKELKSAVIAERKKMEEELKSLPLVLEIFPSEANFLLFRVEQADKVYRELIEHGIVVRNRSTQYNCENTLRVSIGNSVENQRFIELMNRL
ncbi:histidinol dehydrogenase [Fluviicola sp.]|uniref:histidinol dehydrogenase n=1 Tax=Fluviicola sp. TaxID=1917219 RepID=UPI002608A5F3|nr:histidinol dehydrogenase [Fluviicola sp.]